MNKACYRKLRGKIVEVYNNQNEFARAIGRTPQTVTAKLNGRTKFTMNDIAQWSKALGLSAEDVYPYFFA